MVTRGATVPAAGLGRVSLVEQLTSRVLFWGGTVSVAIVLVGLALQLGSAGVTRHGTVGQLLSPDASARPPGVFVSPGEIARGLRPGPRFDPLAVVALGLGCLLLTPIVGVAAAVLGFLVSGDQRYTLVAMLVLAILIASFFIGGGGE